MKARLVGYTQPAADFKDNFHDVQSLIAYCARVSNPSNQMNNKTGEKLIRYLIKHKHWSPLEMASATIEVETTRDIARQLLRHRSFSFQEFSTLCGSYRRYGKCICRTKGSFTRSKESSE